MDSKDQILGGNPAEEEEARDLIEGVDEDGNNVLLEVVRYFFYNGEEYVVLGDAHDGCCDCGCEHCDHDHDEDEEEEAVNLYIMKWNPSFPWRMTTCSKSSLRSFRLTLKPTTNWTINGFCFPHTSFLSPVFSIQPAAAVTIDFWRRKRAGHKTE